LVFLNEDGTPIEEAVFTDDRENDGAWEFIIGDGPLTDTQYDGDYTLKWKFFFSDAPGNVYESDPFDVSIIDVCNPHDPSYDP
jgi:hypothetical protein